MFSVSLEHGGALESSKGGSGIDDRQWNALIGVVTAIVGNILISFALNLQRYAHIRLDREQLQRSKSWVSRKGKSSTRIKGYGTQIDVANERAEMNRDAPIMDEEDAEHEARYHSNENRYQNGENNDEGETAPLKGYRRSSESTVSTVRQETGDNDVFNQSYLKSPYWWAGICLMTIGEAGNFLAYGFAPASIVSPLGVVALISNCIIAPVFLKEHFRQRDFWGVVVAVGGAVTVVLSAKQEETRLGPNDLWAAITRWEFELYLGITAGAIVALMWASGKYGQKTILIDLGLVGLFGAYTALSTKGVASLLSDTLWRAITFPITYLLVFILVATAALQIRYVNRALQRFDSTQVIPTQFVLFTLSVIIGSAVLYRDFESVTGERMAKFIGGCVLTFSGVYLITSRRAKTGSEDDEEADLEDGIGLLDDEGLQDALRSKVNGNGGANTDGAAYEAPTSQKTNGSTRSDRSIVPVIQSPKRQLSHASPQRNPQTPQRQPSSATSMSSSPYETDYPYLENPWASAQQSQEYITTPPTLSHQSTSISNPPLPTVSDSATSTPRRLTGSRLNSFPRDQQLDRISLARRSMSRIVPGPIVTPLSSSLSGVVADALRNSPSVRRRGGVQSLRKARPQRANELAAQDTGETSVPAVTAATAGVAGGPFLSRGHSEGAGRELVDTEEIDRAAQQAKTDKRKPEGKKSRSKSLSDTIGALFHRDGREQ